MKTLMPKVKPKPGMQLEDAVSSLIHAVNTRDFEKIRTLLAPTFEADNTFQPGRTINREEFIGYLRRLSDYTDYHVRIRDCTFQACELPVGKPATVDVTLSVYNDGLCPGIAKQAVYFHRWVFFNFGWACVRQQTAIGVDTFGSV